MIEIERVKRERGRAIQVEQRIGGIQISWGRRGNQLVEISRVKPDARIYDPAQLEIPTKIYDAAHKQVFAIFFPKKTSQKPQTQLTLF